MFSREAETNLDPYFRIVYLLEVIAVLATVGGMLLAWWEGQQTFTLFGLLNRSIDELRTRSPHVLAQPLIVLWLVLPSVLVSGLRSITGVLVVPVSYRWLALAVCGVALIALAHFYINFGEDIPDHSPLKDGTIRAGFWLTTSSTAILALLILSEGAIKPRRDTFAASGPTTTVDDAERIWRGEYQTCPYCGMLNEPGAKSCTNCHNLLFDFTRDKRGK